MTRAHAPTVAGPWGLHSTNRTSDKRGEFVRTSEIHGCSRASADSGAAPRGRARGDVPAAVDEWSTGRDAARDETRPRT